MKLKIFNYENLVFLAWVFAIISIVFQIKANKKLDLDMFGILVLLTLALGLKEDKREIKKIKDRK